jgi:hypothetical protein
MAPRRQMLGLMTALYSVSILLFCQSLLSRGEVPPLDAAAASAGTTSTTNASTAATTVIGAETDMSTSATTAPNTVTPSSSSSGSIASGSTPAGSTRMVPDKEADEIEDVPKRAPKSVNFASFSAGAVVLDKSEKSSGYNNLLNEDKDKYGISPCSEKKWVVIGLSEDIIVRSVVVANYEKYSSYLQDFQVLGSATHPVSEWLDLGSYSAEPKLGEQEFELSNPALARYLKFRFLTHFGDEFYCTLSQIRVHGLTMYENFKQEVERSDEEVRVMHSALLTDGVILPGTQGMDLDVPIEIGSAEVNVSVDVVNNSYSNPSSAESNSESGLGDILDEASHGNSSDKNGTADDSFVADTAKAEVNHLTEPNVRVVNEVDIANIESSNSHRVAEPSDDLSTDPNVQSNAQRNQEHDSEDRSKSSSSDSYSVVDASHSQIDDKEGIRTDGIASIYKSDELDEPEQNEKLHHGNDLVSVVETGPVSLDGMRGVNGVSNNSDSTNIVNISSEVNTTEVRSQPISAFAMVCRLAANIVGEMESICQSESVPNTVNALINNSDAKDDNSTLLKSSLDHNDTTGSIHATAVMDSLNSTAAGKSFDATIANQHELNSSNVMSDKHLSRSDSAVEVSDKNVSVADNGNASIFIDFSVNQSSQQEGHKITSNEGKVAGNETKLSDILNGQSSFASESQRASSNSSEANSDAGVDYIHTKANNIDGAGNVLAYTQKSYDGQDENSTVFVSEGFENNTLATALIKDMEKISVMM